MSVLPRELTQTAPAAVFEVVDVFARDRGLAGPGGGIAPIGPLRIEVIATGGPAARRPVDPPWELVLVESSPGILLSYGRFLGEQGVRYLAVGPPLAVDIEVSSPLYCPLTLPAQLAGGKLVPSLVNVDPAAPLERPVPVAIELHPGAAYPFPPLEEFALVRGSVRRTDGRAVFGAQVAGQIGGWAETTRTDRTGQWVFVVPNAAVGQITVVVSLPPQPDQQQQHNVEASEVSALDPFVFP
jgi:hypothetical protein